MSDQPLFFWQNWRNPYRAFYILILLLVLLSLVLGVFFHIEGRDTILSWFPATQLQEIKLPIDSFTKGLFNFSVELESYYVTEQFVASLMQVNPWAMYGLLGVISLSVVLLLSLISVLPRFWYIGAMAIFILMLASFKLDLLEVFGWKNSTFFMVVVALYGSLSYYFHAFRSHTSFPLQFLSFAGLTIGIALVIAFFSESTYPTLSLISHGIIVPVALSVIVILVVAQEIVHGFLYLVTKGGGFGGDNSLTHFTVITFFYLFNVLLAYLHNSLVITWDIFYLNAFFVFAISLVLGLWGFRKRSGSFDTIIPFTPHGAFLYLGLALITVSTITYFFATANDPMIEMFEDAILFSHLAMGIVFYAYVLVNFKTPMQQGLAVHRVVYQPKAFPFYYARALSVIIVAIMLFYANFYPVYQSVAGYFNNLGDLYTLKQDYFLAEQYYRLGVQYDYRNHKSNYAIASLARNQGDKVSAITHLKQATTKNTSPYTYGSLSDIYQQEELIFEALFNLQQGIKKFPNSGELHNNLGLLYNQTNISDSAYYYFNQAAELTSKPEVVQANLLAFWIKNRNLYPINTDSLLAKQPGSEDASLQNNRLVLAQLATLTDEAALLSGFAKDSVLTRERFAYLFNYTLHHKRTSDSSLVKLITGLETIERNAIFSEDLRLAQAAYEYYANDRARGLDQLNLIVAGKPSRGIYFNKILGLWLLQQNIFSGAATHFKAAADLGDSTSLPNYAIALSEAGQWPEALVAWSSLGEQAEEEMKMTAAQMQTIGQAILTGQPASAAATLDDAGKALLVHFSKDILLPQVAGNIATAEYRVRALAGLAEQYIQRDSLVQANQILELASRSRGTSEELQALVKAIQLHLLYVRNDATSSLPAVDSANVPQEYADEKLFWKARSYEKAKQYAQADQYYRLALKRLPTDPATVNFAVNFNNTIRKNPEQGYQISLTALQLHPFSPELLKTYILQCLEMRLLTYAEENLDKLQFLTGAADYQSFLRVYEAKRASIENMLSDWE
jgi:Tfp pilus assembly protein PilF